MKDEQLEREIRAALLRDEPPAMSADLRHRVEAIPSRAVPSRAGRPPLRLAGLVGPARALGALAAAVALVAALAYLRGTTVGPAESGQVTPSVGASSTPGATPSATAPTASPSAASGVWQGLKWSAPATLPDAVSVADVVPWHGELIAVGLAQGATAEGQVAFWRSTDGKAWARLSVDATAFTGSLVSRLLITPSGLVAWGWAGEPVCTGEGAGTTCGPTPAMIWTSADGLSWTRIADASTFKGATIVGLASGSHGLVAAGYLGWSEPAIWTSAAGSTWQRLSLSSATFQGAHFSDVRAIASGYVLAGSLGGSDPTQAGGGSSSAGVAAAWLSLDGRTWTAATVQRVGDVGTSLGTIHVGMTGMVAIGSASGGNAGAAWASADGRTWQPLGLAVYGADAAPTGIATLPALGVADDGTRLVAFGHGSSGGNSGLAMWISSNGAAWLPLPFSGVLDVVPEAPGETPGASVARVFVVPDGVIVVGQAGSTKQLPVWHVLALP
jgi:hypothetical protein